VLKDKTMLQSTYLLLTWEENWTYIPTFGNVNCFDKVNTVLRPREIVPHERQGWWCVGCIMCCVL